MLQTEGEWHNLDRIAVLKEENNTQFAVKIWEVLMSTLVSHKRSTKLYKALHQVLYMNLIMHAQE